MVELSRPCTCPFVVCTTRSSLNYDIKGIVKFSHKYVVNNYQGSRICYRNDNGAAKEILQPQHFDRATN
jgi:hypothetical protein